jgi:hypothetical protein
MKLFFIIIITLSIQNIGLTQNIKENRVLRPLIQERDTTLVKVEYDKSNRIIYLNQKYQKIIVDTTFIIVETYRNNFWSLYKFKLVKEVIKDDTIIHRSIDGKQYRFNIDGQITHIDNYINGELDKNSFEVEYYSTGGLKYILKKNNEGSFNYLDYRYPNGKIYDFGDFKNGQGKVIHLNDKGIPCIESTTKGNKTEIKLLCDDYK